MTAPIYRIALAFVAAGATGLVAGCVPAGEEAVAVVDGENKITVAEVEFYYERGVAAGEWPEGEDLDARVKDIVDAAVVGKILELEAEDRGYADDPDIKRQLEDIRNQKLIDYMFARVEASIPVTQAEVLDYYEKSRHRRMYSFIMTESPEKAEEAYAALRAGMPWDQAVTEFSTFEAYAGPGGKWDAPMDYIGDEASEAVFGLEIGEYSRPVEVPGGYKWQIYKYDKEGHGSGQSFAEAAPDIELVLRRQKTFDRFKELAAGWRRAVAIERNEELWQDILNAPCDKLWNEYPGRNLVISEVSGIPVYYDAVWDLVQKFFGIPPDAVEEERKSDPERYEAMWDRYVRDFEDLALMRHQALREGVDQLPSFRMEMASRRAELLVDALYQNEFAANIPAPSEEEIRTYYEAHRDVFYNPERVEIYLVAMPGRDELERFYGEIKAGADLVITGEARNRAREKTEQEMAEPPPPVPPEERERLGVVAISAEPEHPNSPPQEPLAAELRPRVFPVPGLNVLSEVFLLKDGRWAFYEPIYHAPALQYDLDDAETAYRCRTEVYAARVQSPETAAAADAWLESLRARHEAVIDDELAARVAAQLRTGSAQVQ
jgi:parvulin-like peptidyl-prolyl isomerase